MFADSGLIYAKITSLVALAASSFRIGCDIPFSTPPAGKLDVIISELLIVLLSLKEMDGNSALPPMIT